LTDACRQHSLNPKEVYQQLLARMDDARLNCIAAEVSQA